MQPTPDAARGETDGGEALPEEVEGQVQAVVALKKRKRVKEKSPFQTSSLKRKRPELASQAHDLEEVSINSTSSLLVFSSVHTHNPQGLLGVSYGSDEEEMIREM